MSSDNPIVISVPFHGDTITAIETSNGEFVAIKPICERLNVSDKGQMQRLKRDPELWGGSVMHLPSGGGVQETFVIPRNRVAFFLATIDVKRVKPEAQETLRLYQREAADVLDQHFRGLADAKTEEIRQLRGQLDHCHSNLRAALPKWGQILAMLEMGTFGTDVMAARVNWTWDRTYTEIQAMRRCGMILPEGVPDNSAPSWLSRIDTLERQLQFERDWNQAQARDMSVADYRRSQGRGAEGGTDVPSDLEAHLNRHEHRIGPVKAEQPDV